MTSPPAVAAFQAAARRLGDHPQDHGWRELYRLFAYGLEAGLAPQLAELVSAARRHRPDSSDIHLVTLLGIAVRSLARPDSADLLAGGGSPAARLAVLEDLLARQRPLATQLITRRQNSFTGARRFLLPQILLAAYFTGHAQLARVADLGTGLGVLPRQLNSPTLFERYAPDLRWPRQQPAFQAIPLGCRHGVDRGPLPDLRWVRSCYGPSEYYNAAFQELLDTLAVPEVAAAQVRYHELDLTEPDRLRRFIIEHRINAVILSYLLYQLRPAHRTGIVDTLAAALRPPGLIVMMEPAGNLTQPGCVVIVSDRADPRPRPVCTVSDGHFRGHVSLLPGWESFRDDYPIRLQPSPSGAVDATSADHAPG